MDACIARLFFAPGGPGSGRRLVTRAPPRRREVLAAGVAGGLPAPLIGPGAARAASDDDLAAWLTFRARFVAADGRVVDTGNNFISHSEGQGWGLFMAATFGDRAAFDLILDWTRRTLVRPDDALSAWRFVPGAPVEVADLNNATDGDLFIGAGLARAARRWGDRAHADAAAAIGRDVLRVLVRDAGGRTVLLPGAAGFERRGAVVVNPSYAAFPALADLAVVAPSSRWAQLARSGAGLVEAGRFGNWMLPPDWLLVPRVAGAALAPAPGWPARFSFDAIRVPLYAAWARAPVPAMLAAFTRYWTAFPPGGTPAWVDLGTGAVAPFAAGAGMQAIAILAGSRERSQSGISVLPPVSGAPDYYAAALIMLARIAWRESASA